MATRRDYEVLAAAILLAEAYTAQDERMKARVAHSIADALRAENPGFRKFQFISACGVTTITPLVTNG